MPLVTITALKGRTAAEKKQIGDVIQAGLGSIGVAAGDRFQRFFDMEESDFIFDRQYPDMNEPRSNDYLLIEITLSVGRSVKVKKQFLDTIIAGLEKLGIAPKDVSVIFVETLWENWAFTAGKLSYI